MLPTIHWPMGRRGRLLAGAAMLGCVALMLVAGFLMSGCGSTEAGTRTSGQGFSSAIYVQGNPNGKVVASKGTIAADERTGDLYKNTNGSKAWTALLSGIGGGDITSITAGAGLTGGGSTGAITIDAVCGPGLVCNVDDVELLDDCSPGDTLIFAPDGENPSTWQCAHNVPTNYKLDRYVVATTNGGLAVTMDDTDTTARKAFVNLQDCATGEVLKDTGTNTWACGTETGRFLGRQTFSASGTYTPTSGTRTVIVRAIGGGGGGGGVKSATSGQVGIAEGGTSGTYAEWRISNGSTLTGGAVVIGAGGSAGAGGATPTSGTNGGDTTVVINGATYTAGKGSLGPSAVSAAANQRVGGNSASAATPTPDVYVRGRSVIGFGVVNQFAAASCGADSPFALGYAGVLQVSNGGNGDNNGTSPGGGGCGGISLGVGASDAGTRNGGTGAAGYMVIDEYN